MGKGNLATRAALALFLSLSPEVSLAAELTPFPLTFHATSRPTPTADALNAGRNCLAAYTPSPGMNPTVVLVNVAVDGSVKNVTVVQSSGNGAFDEAARSCVGANWRYHPASRDGKPTEAVEKLMIKWVFIPKHVGPEDRCDVNMLPVLLKSYGPIYVDMSFTIATDGSLKNVKVTKPSGDARIDYDAASCVSDWHYQPIMKDGQPIEYAWSARVLVGRIAR